MPINDVVDESYLSGNPSKTGFPMVPAPQLDPYQEGYVDAATTLAAQAVVGQLVVKQIAATNTGGAYALLSAVANQVLMHNEFGICTKAPLSLASATGVMVHSGTCFAFCTTTGTAIAVGTLLSADGAGNLTVAPGSPTPGQILARSYGTLAASTSTPTLVLVQLGGA
jgi:hypothetical protein